MEDKKEPYDNLAFIWGDYHQPDRDTVILQRSIRDFQGNTSTLRIGLPISGKTLKLYTNELGHRQLAIMLSQLSQEGWELFYLQECLAGRGVVNEKQILSYSS